MFLWDIFLKNKLDMCDNDEIHVDFRSSDLMADVKHSSDVTQIQLSMISDWLPSAVKFVDFFCIIS